MKMRKAAAAGPVLALAILVGCQGGDAADSLGSPTPYEATAAYTNDRHPIGATTDDPDSHAFESELERLINEHRLSRKLGALRVMPELKELALAHSIHMGLHEPAFFDHANPEGHLPEDRAGVHQIVFRTIGENIAAGQSAAEAVFRSWMDSPSHRANIEDPRWTHMGAGHAYLPESPYVTYWTLDLIER